MTADQHGTEIPAHAYTDRLYERVRVRRLQAKLDIAMKALTNISERWEAETPHTKTHDPDTCEGAVCVARRALASLEKVCT